VHPIVDGYEAQSGAHSSRLCPELLNPGVIPGVSPTFNILDILEVSHVPRRTVFSAQNCLSGSKVNTGGERRMHPATCFLTGFSHLRMPHLCSFSQFSPRTNGEHSAQHCPTLLHSWAHGRLNLLFLDKPGITVLSGNY